MKKPLPFSVFKRANRPCYLVAFKNEKTGTYLPPISTRQTDETAAIKTAYEWFKNGVPQKDKVVNLKEYTLRDLAKEADKADAGFIVNELKRRGLLKSAVLTDTKQDKDFSEFITKIGKTEKHHHSGWNNSPVMGVQQGNDGQGRNAGDYLVFGEGGGTADTNPGISGGCFQGTVERRKGKTGKHAGNGYRHEGG